MTFMEALANPETRRIIDAIEDMKASLDGRGEDDPLWDVFHHACRELEEKNRPHSRLRPYHVEEKAWQF